MGGVNDLASSAHQKELKAHNKYIHLSKELTITVKKTVIVRFYLDLL